MTFKQMKYFGLIRLSVLMEQYMWQAWLIICIPLSMMEL